MIDAGMGSGQLLTLFIIALALGMDAFSLGIGIGLRGIEFRHTVKISAVIAMFHIVMPLIGIFTGKYVGMLLGHVTTVAAGGLLLLLGGHMIYSSLRGGNEWSVDPRSGLGVMLFALSVSIDSFSTGISLGMFAADIVLTVLLIGFFGGLMSILGLMIGTRISASLGEYGEACGGVILFTFGLLFIF